MPRKVVLHEGGDRPIYLVGIDKDRNLYWTLEPRQAAHFGERSSTLRRILYLLPGCRAVDRPPQHPLSN